MVRKEPCNFDSIQKMQRPNDFILIQTFSAPSLPRVRLSRLSYWDCFNFMYTKRAEILNDQIISWRRWFVIIYRNNVKRVSLFSS